MKLDIDQSVGHGSPVGFGSEDEHVVAHVGGSTERLAAQPRSAAAAGEFKRRFRSLMLGWTDPDSGDRLTARVRGGAELIDELESLGFEILEDAPGQVDAPVSASDATRTRQVSVVTELTRATRSGASRRGSRA